jgi:ATP-dependent DNA helicase RecQ
MAGERRELVDGASTVVGRLSRGCLLNASLRCVAVRVSAVLVRKREDAAAPYQEGLRCERWEVVVAELVMEPG